MDTGEGRKGRPSSPSSEDESRFVVLVLEEARNRAADLVAPRNKAVTTEAGFNSGSKGGRLRQQR